MLLKMVVDRHFGSDHFLGMFPPHADGGRIRPFVLEADGEQQANGDDGDVNEDIFPGVNALVGRMRFEHDLSPVKFFTSAHICDGAILVWQRLRRLQSGLLAIAAFGFRDGWHRRVLCR